MINKPTVNNRNNEFLEKSHSYFAPLLNGMFDSVMLIDPQYKILDVNDFFLEQYKKSRKEVIGHNCFDITHDKKSACTKNNDCPLKVIMKTKAPYRTEHKHRDCLGKNIDVEIYSFPVLSPDGEIEFIAEIMHDVTEKKKTELKLKEINWALQSLISASPLPIITIDKNANVKLWNCAAENIFGWKEKEVNNCLIPIVHKENMKEFNSILGSVFKGKTLNGIEKKLFKKDGNKIEARLSLAPLYDAEGKISNAMSIIEDITENKSLERQILEISEMEQRRIGQDLHDSLGQQLTGIAFLGKVLKEKLEKKSLPETKDVEEILKHLKLSISHTQDLALGLSPVNDYTDSLMYAIKDLSNSIQNVFGLSCIFNCDKPVYIDNHFAAVHIYRIAQEALNNAIKHSKANNIYIKLSEEDNQVYLSIEDDGVGIKNNINKNNGMGLVNMQYRSRIIGASLQIDQVQKGGTKITFIYSKTG